VRAALHSRQSGSTAVEFALVLLLFLTFLLAVTDFGRMLYTWNAAAEATRAGARYAAVCDSGSNKAAVLAKMQKMMPQLTDANLSLAWQDDMGNSCTPSTCMGVTVTVNNLTYRWISPIAGLGALPPFPMPTFKTFLTREIMRQDPNSPTIC
jgi:Flp pilus assembly protein TadG